MIEPGPPVFGQGDSMFASVCDAGALSHQATASDLCGPDGVALDGSNNLFVADQGNNRVVIYRAATPHRDPDAQADRNSDAQADRDADA
ncbi:MAG TPA: hypothetical protein VN754_01990 [Candidatus Binataceae bacterium]|nr:hypothetical protein [Candidatus Binataceae bacterium]